MPNLRALSLATALLCALGSACAAKPPDGAATRTTHAAAAGAAPDAAPAAPAAAPDAAPGEPTAQAAGTGAGGAPRATGDVGRDARREEEPARNFLDLPRSTDDRGFSIVLMSPTDLFLTGRQVLRIEAIIPRGDTMEQVDFFLDGRLVATDKKAPYETAAEFGPDMRRHTIEIRAATEGGLRARVSLVTRSGDISEGSAGRIVSVPVMARRDSGEFIEDLSVSDFVLTEDGDPRSIAYFTPGPFPASIAVVVEGGAEETGGLAGPLAAFLRSLPDHYSMALVEGPFSTPEAAAAAFSFDPAPLIERLRASSGGSEPPAGFETRARAAASALDGRRGLRALLVVLAPGASGAGRVLLEDPAAEAVEAALETGAAVYTVAVGGSEAAWPAEALRDAAGRSGGAFLAVADGASLPTALNEIGLDLRHRYLLGFMPADETRNGWRAIQVRLRAREGVLRAPRSVYLR